MTLRVTVEIVPFGKEEDKRTIEVINISNINFEEPATHPLTNYVIEHNDYKNFDKDTPRIEHVRHQGALTLVRLALQKLGF